MCTYRNNINSSTLITLSNHGYTLNGIQFYYLHYSIKDTELKDRIASNVVRLFSLKYVHYFYVCLFVFHPGVIFIFLGGFTSWLIYFLSTLSPSNNFMSSISLLQSIIYLDYLILPSLSTQLTITN